MGNQDKKARSEAQRLQSIQDRIALEKKKKEAVSLSLQAVDNADRSNRTVFNDSDSDDNAETQPTTSTLPKRRKQEEPVVEEEKEKDEEDGEEDVEEQPKRRRSKRISQKSFALFDDDEDEDNTDLDKIVFENKHKGRKGEKLMQMEARYVSTDDRFKMSNKFLSESEESEDEMETEKRKNRDLLSKVLGKVVHPQQKTVNVAATSESIPHRPFTRFDPTNAEHVAWVKKYGSKIAEKKNKKLTIRKEEEDEDAKNRDSTIDRTTHKKFFEMDAAFSEQLKTTEESAEKPEKFSFLASVGRKSNDNNNEEKALPEKDDDIPLLLPTPTVSVLKLKKGGSNFFISSNDQSVMSVIANFRRTQSDQKTLHGWTNYRNSIMKIYHQQRKLALKHDPWRDNNKRSHGDDSDGDYEGLARRPKKKKLKIDLQVVNDCYPCLTYSEI